MVEPGSALKEALKLAQEVAAFPQDALRADRRSANAQWSVSTEDAVRAEFQGGVEVITSGEAQKGARRFAEGAGRHGS